MANESDKTEAKAIDCLEAFDHLYAYLNNEITDQADLANIEHHLSHCKNCYSRAEMERKLNQRMKHAGENRIPASLQDRLNKLINDL